MASVDQINTAFKNAGAGTPSDAQINFYSNPNWADAGNVEGDVRAGGNGKSQLPSLDLSQLGPSTSDFITNTVNPMEDKAFSDYLMASRAQQTPTQMYSTFENEAGIPQLRTTASNLQGQVNDLTDAITAVEPRVNATTQNSLVTEGQRSGMVAAQKYPMQQILTPLSGKLAQTETSINNQEANIDKVIGYAVQSNAQQLAPYQQQLTMMSDRANRLITGFTTDRQNQLQVLLAKYNAGQALNKDEIDQAAQLTQMEKEYSLKMQADAAQATNQINVDNNKLIKVGKNGYVYDPTTGTIVAGNAAGAGTGGTGVNFGSTGASDLGGGNDPLSLMG